MKETFISGKWLGQRRVRSLLLESQVVSGKRDDCFYAPISEPIFDTKNNPKVFQHHQEEVLFVYQLIASFSAPPIKMIYYATQRKYATTETMVAGGCIGLWHCE